MSEKKLKRKKKWKVSEKLNGFWLEWETFEPEITVIGGHIIWSARLKELKRKS